ncbi:MAG: GNAT family N-acetyltransferase [Hyphomicrobiaceae bacterium]|nr:GNAT family N-acetyltransferase [Hyphomicrobiaceae bacterium]
MSNPECTIRAAEQADSARIAEIFAHYVTSGLANWEHLPPDAAAIATRIGQLTAAGYPYLVAHCSSTGTVLGYAYGSSFHAQSGWRYTVEDSIYVAPAAQRQGIGRALLSCLIDECTARGFRQMIAGISQPGGEGSIAFHEALGFRLVGTLPNVGWKHGEWLTAHYYQRALGDGATTPPP